jgi:hypothetical protein
LKTTIRASVFETNSSSSHTYIHVTKETFEAWKRGKKVLIEKGIDCHMTEGTSRGKIFTEGFYNATYKERDFVDEERTRTDKSLYGTMLTYEDMLEYLSELGCATVRRSEAKEEYIVEEWEDDEFLLQGPYMEVKDDGKKVTVHIWGRLD